MICYESRRGMPIKWIIIHYPVALGNNTTWLLHYYEKSSVKTSAHYAVDSNSTISIVHTKYAANHCKTSGLQTFCGATNRNSIGIDLMDDKINKKSTSVNDNDWFIPYQTINRAASLVAFLMKKYSIDIDHVVRHYDVTHKMCPRPFVGNDTNGYYNKSGNEVWAEFKAMIKKEYGDAQ